MNKLPEFEDLTPEQQQREIAWTKALLELLVGDINKQPVERKEKQ